MTRLPVMFCFSMICCKISVIFCKIMSRLIFKLNILLIFLVRTLCIIAQFFPSCKAYLLVPLKLEKPQRSDNDWPGSVSDITTI